MKRSDDEFWVKMNTTVSTLTLEINKRIYLLENKLLTQLDTTFKYIKDKFLMIDNHIDNIDRKIVENKNTSQFFSNTFLNNPNSNINGSMLNFDESTRILPSIQKEYKEMIKNPK